MRITELGEEGSVPNLKVANLGDRPLLLLDGEQLVGAKQNRILNMTVLVAAHTEVTIPVSCVERGRWGYRARHSSPSDVSLYAGLRAKKSAWVSRSLRDGRGSAADQQGVWEALAQKAGALLITIPNGNGMTIDPTIKRIMRMPGCPPCPHAIQPLNDASRVCTSIRSRCLIVPQFLSGTKTYPS